MAPWILQNLQAGTPPSLGSSSSTREGMILGVGYVGRLGSIIAMVVSLAYSAPV